MIQRDRCRKYKLYSFFSLLFNIFVWKLDCLHTRIFSKNNTETNECEKKFHFPWYTFPSLYFATITKPHRCVVWLVDAQRCRETRMWLAWDSHARAGVTNRDWIWRGDDVGRNEGWAVYLRRRFSVFLPLAISRRSRVAFQAHRFPEDSRLSSHLSLVTLSSFLGGVPWDSVVPRYAGISSLREIISSLY